MCHHRAVSSRNYHFTWLVEQRRSSGGNKGVPFGVGRWLKIGRKYSPLFRSIEKANYLLPVGVCVTMTTHIKAWEIRNCGGGWLASFFCFY